MIRLIPFSILALLCISSATHAASWSLKENSSGYVFKSDSEVLYIGKNCDSLSPTHGKGYWYWNEKDKNLEVHLEERSYSFDLKRALYSDARCSIEKKPESRQLASKPRIDCNSIDVDDEKIACYVLTVGPKACTQAISESNPVFASSISERMALAGACTAAVKSVYAQNYVSNDLMWNIADELLETGCSKMTDDNAGLFTKLFVGLTSCATNAVVWSERLRAADACASEIERQCGS